MPDTIPAGGVFLVLLAMIGAVVLLLVLAHVALSRVFDARLSLLEDTVGRITDDEPAATSSGQTKGKRSDFQPFAPYTTHPLPQGQARGANPPAPGAKGVRKEDVGEKRRRVIEEAKKRGYSVTYDVPYDPSDPLDELPADKWAARIE